MGRPTAETATQIRIRKDTLRQLQVVAAAKDVSIVDLIDELLHEPLRRALLEAQAEIAKLSGGPASKAKK